MNELSTIFADLLPPLSTDEFRSLESSIKSDGVRNPILIDEQGNILDGHHRYRIDPNAPTSLIKGLSDAGKRAFVISSNYVRRNLSPDQKTELREKQKSIAAELKEEGHTQEKIAALLGVAQQTICDWLMPITGSSNRHNSSKQRKKTDGEELPDCRVKLTKMAKEKVSERVKAKETQAQIAADFWDKPISSLKNCQS